MKQLIAIVMSLLCAAWIISCSQSLDTSDAGSGENAARTVVSGTNGTVTVSGMTSCSLTVSYSPGSEKNYARLYVSEGNGSGLVLANQDMIYSSGTYSYTLTNSTFTSGALIYVCVLVNDSGTESCLPQGVLSDTTSWSQITYGKSSSSDETSSDLVSLASGYEMTFQFANNTSSKYADSSIYICCIGRNAAGNFCYLKPDGTLVPISSGSSSTSWSYKLSDLSSGMQVPATFTSGRLYISMDKPVVMSGIIDGAGNVGVVQPDLNNSSDANASTIFDWIEFTVTGGGFWGNTTQVDQFGLPVTMAMYNDSGYYRTVGITESRDAIFCEFKSEEPAEFQTLIQSTYRIIAPCKGEFRTGKTYGSYMSSYVDEVWNYYAANTVTVSHPLGVFNIHASGDQLIFTCTDGYGTAVTGLDYYITGKPDNNALMEGSGVLASGNTVEKALQAQMCAALNRHVAANPSAWATPASYYGSAPCNYYAKFWHNHSIDGYAYGFCYDDVADQSPLIETHEPRGLVIGIGF
jgi:hypothetical protein